MQTREVIKEIRWIRSLVSTELENWVFHKGMKEEPDVIRCIVDASQFADRLSRNAAAVQIMQAFGLDQLADRETFYAWVQGNTGSAARHRETSDADKHAKEMAGHSLTIAWRTMMSFVDPFEKLTTPEEMRTPELPKTFISFEIAGIDAENTPLPILSKATGFAKEAYEAVCRVYQTKDGDHLALVKIESGYIIRIDCKGLGEPIKHLKNLILEAWHKLRHKRAEEVLENSKAVLGSLAVIEHIAKRERDGSLSSEEAEQLRRNIVTSVCGLFECGALIAEIPTQETVENTKLLSGFSPKLLMPPSTDGKAAAKQTTPKKRSSKRRKT